ncbi:MAG: hypothetical protein HC830_05315, partial [Bacteroidetes bacterium]|nr:hypothetical protein [Bacteroidota bacterium]
MIQRNIPLPEETPQRFGVVRKMENLPISDGFIKGKGKLEIQPWGETTILLDQQ